MDNKAVQNYIEVDFSGIDENGNFYGDCISVKIDDLKVIKQKKTLRIASFSMKIGATEMIRTAHVSPLYRTGEQNNRTFTHLFG